MICFECVTPGPLKKLFDTYGTDGECKYCGRNGYVVESMQLFNYVYERVIENVAGKDDLSLYEHCQLYDCGSDFVAVQEIDIVLMEWFDLGNEPYFDDLCKAVPAEFVKNNEGGDTHFYSDDGTLERNVYEHRWMRFVDDVHHKHRYFNAGADKFLDSVFSVLVTEDDQLKPEVLRTITRGEMLYRARLAQTQKQAEVIIKNPADEFGPTPKHLASSQRMTPNGVSALYCSLDRETCLSEIRSITGDQVVSAALTPISELKLLDLTALYQVEPPALTLLEKGCRDSLHRKVFLGALVKKMSRPKDRNDELSYLSTQVVFEYLRLRFGKYVQGLVFPSVQTGELGTNIVLFPEASSLESQPPAEHVPKGGPARQAAPPLPTRGQPAILIVVPDSIRFHKITAIETKAMEYAHIHDLFMSDLTHKRLGLIQSEQRVTAKDRNG